MKRFLFPLSLVLLLAGCERQPEIAQWRGPNRDGIYPSKGLQKEWPKEGPQLLWACDSIGDGYGSPVVTHDALFIRHGRSLLVYNIKQG